MFFFHSRVVSKIEKYEYQHAQSQRMYKIARDFVGHLREM